MTGLGNRTIAVLPLIVVNWMVFWSILSLRGLIIWVIGGSVVAIVVTDILARRRFLLRALVVGAFITVAMAALARWFAGNTSGPVTRSTFLVTGLIVAIIVIAWTSRPLLSLLPAAALTGSGLILGAAVYPPILTGVWVVAAAWATITSGPYPSRALGDKARAGAIGIVVLFAGASAGAAAVIAAQVFDTPLTLGPALTAEPIPDPLSDASEPPPPPPSSPSNDAADAAPESPVVNQLLQVLIAVTLAVLALLAIWMVFQILKRAWIAFQWRRTARRLNRGTVAERLLGSWQWLRLNAARRDNPYPVSLSPDLAGRAARTSGDTELANTLELIAQATFHPSSSIGSFEAGHAWQTIRTRLASSKPRGIRALWRYSAVTVRTARERDTLVTDPLATMLPSRNTGG